MSTDAQTIEAILFWRGEPVSLSELSRMLQAPLSETTQALRALQETRTGGGLSVVVSDNEAALVTAPAVSEIISRLQKEELSRELSRAALETLSIIAYLGPVPRRDIENIRGVNSTSILRALLIRGLIGRAPDDKNGRVLAYCPTTELLALLGIRGREELPEFALVSKEIQEFNASQGEATGSGEEMREKVGGEESR